MKLFTTFDEAVTEGDLELADASLRLIEVSIMLRNDESPATDLVMNELVRCHAHLWHLRHASGQAVAA